MEAPERPPKRANITLRMLPVALTWIDSLRTPHHTRADVLRACLAVARKHETEVKTLLKETSQ